MGVNRDSVVNKKKKKKNLRINRKSDSKLYVIIHLFEQPLLSRRIVENHFRESGKIKTSIS